jgi:hypothetical protein
MPAAGLVAEPTARATLRSPAELAGDAMATYEGQ